jgi:hypothetical protein
LQELIEGVAKAAMRHETIDCDEEDIQPLDLAEFRSLLLVPPNFNKKSSSSLYKDLIPGNSTNAPFSFLEVVFTVHQWHRLFKWTIILRYLWPLLGCSEMIYILMVSIFDLKAGWCISKTIMGTRAEPSEL